MFKLIISLFATLLILSCSSSFKKQDLDEIELKKAEFEFQQNVKSNSVEVNKSFEVNKTAELFIDTPKSKSENEKTSDFADKKVPIAPIPTRLPTIKKQTEKNIKIKKEITGKETIEKESKKKLEPIVHQRLPLYEDSVGFSNGQRRPDVMPFAVGEKVVLNISYLKFTAAQLTLEIPDIKIVNGRQNYNLITKVKTTPTFSKLIYEGEDWSESLMDYEYLTPINFALHVRESAQLKEGRATFDMLGGKAHHLETKISKKKGKQEKNNTWDILPFSQNVFSAAFYMRVFKWEVGQEYKFNVADEKENIMFSGKALRKEKIQTELGEINTIVIQPKFTSKGVFKPAGEIFFWLTDDDKKQIVRLEASIKIGTLVAEVVELQKGTPLH